ncbi:MAG: polysaccharide deacetylase family protein [Proteobacteria bacterium]|nr:polysaccharide deacetylase family protein [Pseudomonadota bacterium]
MTNSVPNYLDRVHKSVRFRLRSFLYSKIIANPRFQMIGEYYYRIPLKERVVALTFDDGPRSPYTESLLVILEKYNIKATFYFIGENIERDYSAAKLVFDKGHQIGNHSYSHPAFLNLSIAQINQEIDKTDQLIRSLGVQGKITFRAPYGKKFLKLPYILWRKKRTHVLFDFFPNPRDFMGSPVNLVADSIISQTRPGSIIVLHDGNIKAAPFVCEYAEKVILGLKSLGYSFVTVDELLRMKN